MRFECPALRDKKFYCICPPIKFEEKSKTGFVQFVGFCEFQRGIIIFKQASSLTVEPKYT